MTLTEEDVLLNGSKKSPARQIWDFDESPSKYRTVTYRSKPLKVVNTGNEKADNRAAGVLYKYQQNYGSVINNMRNPNYVKKLNLNNYQKQQLKLMTDIHKPHNNVMEINDRRFSGMNKPYQISLKGANDVPYIGPVIKPSQFGSLCFGTGMICENKARVAKILGYMRPKNRKLFFNARTPYNEGLLVHELAHTAANHVMFRPNDHGRDFVEAERLVKLFVSK